MKEAALCGVHCLNTLLQGPLFGAIELGQIAQDLDALERTFMSENGIESEDYKKFIAEDSGNVSSDGFFSIQASELYVLQADAKCRSLLRRDKGLACRCSAKHCKYSGLPAQTWTTLK